MNPRVPETVFVPRTQSPVLHMADLSRSVNAFVAKVNMLIEHGCFALLEIPQLRVEGTTAWGVWLRINSSQGAFSRCPRLLCGVLFHCANRTLTFHGNATLATNSLLPIFQKWTYEEIVHMDAPSRPYCTDRLDSALQADPDSISSGLDENPMEAANGAVSPGPTRMLDRQVSKT